MKKIWSVLLIVIMVFGMSMTVLADGVSPITGTGDNAVTLNYSVASTYSISIPATVAVTGINGTESTYSINSHSLIAAGQKLQLSVDDSTNYDYVENKFRMISQNDVGIKEYLEYSITKPGTPNPISISRGNVILEADPAKAYEGESVVLTYKAGNAHAAGEYSDTVTITVSLVTNGEEPKK